METKKEKIELNDYEIQFIIDVLKHDKTNLQCVLNNEELDYVLLIHKKLIDKLNNILILSDKKEFEKRTNKVKQKALAELNK